MTDLDLLVAAARRSGDIARGFFRENPAVWDKGDNAGPVTEGDLAVNEMLERHLKAARPDYGWLSEESLDDPARLDKTRIFVIDPIDGTRAFIKGSKDWAHALAVIEDGDVTTGAIYLPMHDQMFAAQKGQGATLNGVPIRVRDRTDRDDASVLGNAWNFEPKYWRGGEVPAVARHFRSSLAFRLALVAQGQFDAMITLRPTWEWDVAAGTLIVTEAGGTVTDQDGKAPQFNNAHPQLNGLLAGNDMRATLQNALAESRVC